MIFSSVAQTEGRQQAEQGMNSNSRWQAPVILMMPNSKETVMHIFSKQQTPIQAFNMSVSWAFDVLYNTNLLVEERRGKRGRGGVVLAGVLHPSPILKRAVHIFLIVQQ